MQPHPLQGFGLRFDKALGRGFGPWRRPACEPGRRRCGFAETTIIGFPSAEAEQAAEQKGRTRRDANHSPQAEHSQSRSSCLSDLQMVQCRPRLVTWPQSERAVK